MGYVEGENLNIERYSAEGHHERYADLVREIVARNPDVIVTGTNPVVRNVTAATSTIPVVAFMLEPLKAGLVTSLAQPGGNLTEITLDAGIEIWEKRLQILKEAMPSTAKAAFLGMRGGWEGSPAQVIRDAADRLGISLVLMLPEKGTPSEIERVFASMEQQRPDAVLVSGEGDLYANRQLIAELAEKNGLPVMCPYRDYVEGICGVTGQARGQYYRYQLDVSRPRRQATKPWARNSSRKANVGGSSRPAVVTMARR